MDTYTTGGNGLPTIKKGAQARLDYTFDWSAWLLPLNEVISSYIVAVSPGITKSSDSTMGGAVTVFLEGGTPGYGYMVSCAITTATRTEVRTIMVDVVAQR